MAWLTAHAVPRRTGTKIAPNIAPSLAGVLLNYVKQDPYDPE
ncbi:MAG: hypothetical protein V4489_06385 [Chlamydiota bacterium]